MKKLCLLLIAMLAMALVMGCGSAPAPSETSSSAARASNRPAWMNEDPPVDEIWGYGSAKLTNRNLAQTTATTTAQTDAARQLGAVVQAMVTNYANESGLVENPRSLMSIESIEKNVVNMTLTGSVKYRFEADDGTWHVCFAVKKADATREAFNVINDEFADYSEYRRENALNALNSAISANQFYGPRVSD